MTVGAALAKLRRLWFRLADRGDGQSYDEGEESSTDDPFENKLVG
jgi:hypothetical protein